MYEPLIKSLIAGLLACLACGLGALPLLLRRLDPQRHAGLGYGFAGGLMFSASVYNLILPGLTGATSHVYLLQVVLVVSGVLLGSLFLTSTDYVIRRGKLGAAKPDYQLSALLIFIAMTIHSIPEGVAVGVGYTSEHVFDTQQGSYIAMAIAIHNIPEGLAVAIPLRAQGASITKCFWAAVLTSLPQPLAAVPAVLASWFFQPIITILMGFAAGAMIFLVLKELIPEALSTESPNRIAWSFVLGFCLMLLVQVVI
jgi:ZIP family zinc transporter